MGFAVRLYDDLAQARDDRERARLIAEAFEKLEERYPELKEVATQGQLRETELRLQKEIKEVEAKLQKEIKEVEARLQKDIREVEAKLLREIKDVEAKLMKEIKEVEVRLTQAIHRQTVWVIIALGAMLGVLRWIEVLAR